MHDSESDISIILSNLIRNKGLSVSEIARRTMVPQPTIHRIITGEHQKPHQKTLRALSNFFNITVDQLTGHEALSAPHYIKGCISQIPLLSTKLAAKWPDEKKIENESVIYDKPISEHAYALKMPDKSMEPLITKNAILIIDPEKIPDYRSLVVVKLHDYHEVLIRQLIKDAGNLYIRPLSQDFDNFKMIALSDDDYIKGTVVEARLNCEEL